MKTQPLSTGPIRFLQFAGAVSGIGGFFLGLAILSRTPSDPDPFRLVFIGVGLAQIIGGIVVGVLLNVIAGIAQAVLDLWKTANGT